MPWKFVCDLWFYEVVTNNDLQSYNEMKWINRKSNNTVKNRWDCVEIFTCAYECVCVCVCSHTHEISKRILFENILDNQDLISLHAIK